MIVTPCLSSLMSDAGKKGVPGGECLVKDKYLDAISLAIPLSWASQDSSLSGYFSS